jgi:hypothetical protein
MGLEYATIRAHQEPSGTPWSAGGERFLIGSVRQGLGEGEDYQSGVSGRFPNGANALIRAWITQMLDWSDEALLQALRGELQASGGGDNGDRMVDVFAGRTGNGGNPLVWPPSSNLARLVLESSGLGTAFENCRSHIYGTVEGQLMHGYIDYREMANSMPPGTLPLPHWSAHREWTGAGRRLRGPLGGTQGAFAYIRNFNVFKDRWKVAMILGINLGDDFGVSDGDCYTPGLCAFWMLQHQRGYRPFKNYVYCEIDYDFMTTG